MKPRHRKVSYRSGLEKKIRMQLEGAGVAYEYEPITVRYIPKPKRYTPDFRLENGVVVETKGFFTSADRAKHLLVKEQHPDLEIRFVFGDASKRLGSTSKTTYGQWATDHGFKWAEKQIPKEWLAE